MIISEMTFDQWLPVIFIGLMGFAVLVYAILDGYDLGVGILLPLDDNDVAHDHRNKMISSIGPFWDANETWLVLAVGIMLIAFPAAHSQILFHLYLPASLMLIGLILRGVAFDFRTKATLEYRKLWNFLFKAGSLLTTLTQGFMLGQYVVSFDKSPSSIAFCILSAICITAAFSYIGSAWLIMKTEGELQIKAVNWAKWSGRATFFGIIAVSIVNTMINPTVFDRWFQFPLVMFALLIPAVALMCFVLNELLLKQLPKANDEHCWLPFVYVIVIFLSSFIGLAFSFFPDIVPGQLTVWEAASAPESLAFILVGAVIVIPVILLYTIFSYRVFHGKATDLKYY